jgi:predicted O-linked N-acetylglucosamine transferase (SPINDLY family)
VKIQPQWVVTPGKQTTTTKHTAGMREKKRVGYLSSELRRVGKFVRIRLDGWKRRE